MNVRSALNHLPPVKHKDIVLYPSPAANSDIITTIHKYFPEAVAQTKELSKHFDGGNAFQTAKNIWYFLKQNVSYIPDGEDKQWLRLPNVLLETGQGDCKSYSLFSNSILKNLGYPAFFRYVSFDRSNATPTHVYSFTFDEKGKAIIIDPVYDRFNGEQAYVTKKDVAMQVGIMTGYTAIDKAKSLQGTFSDSVVHTAAQVALLVARQSFLALVALNVFNLATKISQAFAKESGSNTFIPITQVIPSSKVAHAWYMLGGDWGDLFRTADKAKSKGAIFGIGSIGVLPAALAAVLAAAAPVIAAIGKVLHDILGGQDLQTIVDDAANVLHANGKNVPDTTGNGNAPAPGSEDSIQKILPLAAAALGAKLLFFS